ncbi:MAG: tetratricopeptide repeat protein [Devosiaceae bacterium]
MRAQSLVPLALAIALLCSHPHVASATSLASDPSLGMSAETNAQPSALDLADQEEPDASALLDALAHSEDGQAADDLARQIQNRWNASGSEAVDVLMRRATIAMRMQNHILALDLLDTVIALAPDFAEGWNRRATVHFLRDDYALSIADVEQVLRLEPRHFGALSGIGIMLDELGQDRPAQMFLSEALRIHPHLTNAKQRLDEIERRLRGAPI